MIGFDSSSGFCNRAKVLQRSSGTFYYLGEDEIPEPQDPYQWLKDLRGEFAACAVCDEVLGARGGIGIYPLFLSSRGFSTSPSKGSRVVRAGEILKASGEVLKRERRIRDSEEMIEDEERAVETLVEALEEIHEEGAIGFSGGLDSSLLAALCEGELFSVCMEGSSDERWLPKAAGLLKKPLSLKIISERDVEGALNRLIEMGFENPLDISIGIPLLLLSEFVREHGVEHLILGQGADELFGGYSRYLRSEKFEEEMLRDINDLDLGLARDSSIILSQDLFPRYPYLHQKIVECALKISPSLKVKKGIRKYVLRRAAERFIPKELAWREKKAIQYSSGVQKAIRKIIKRKGFKRLRDYLEVSCDDR